MRRDRRLVLARAAGIIASLVGGWTTALAAEPDRGKLVVTFAGLKEHGLAILIQTPAGHTWFYDSGSKGKNRHDAPETIGPLLEARDVREIAGLLLSHPHADHFGGAPWLMEHFAVKRLIDSGYEGRGQTDAYRALRKEAVKRGAAYLAVHSGDRLEWDPALLVEVLSPPKEFVLQDADPAKVSEHSVLNNNSIVLRLQHGRNVFLFPGDAYGSEGSYLLKTWKSDKLRAQVLCAPHHGYNATPGYAAVVKPEIVVASCLARYGESPIPSPAEQARKIFGPLGAKVYSTATDGNVQITSDGQTLSVKTER